MGENIRWLSDGEIEYKTIEEFEWSMGNGQCDLCGGHQPEKHWWTDTVGHNKKCPLANMMEEAGKTVIYEMPNPERTVGSFFNEAGIMETIRYNDPNKEQKFLRAKEIAQKRKEKL